jgi:adenine phosphoribosyltransferase
MVASQQFLIDVYVHFCVSCSVSHLSTMSSAAVASTPAAAASGSQLVPGRAQKQCPSCRAICAAARRECLQCQHVFVRKSTGGGDDSSKAKKATGAAAKGEEAAAKAKEVVSPPVPAATAAKEAAKQTKGKRKATTNEAAANSDAPAAAASSPVPASSAAAEAAVALPASKRARGGAGNAVVPVASSSVSIASASPSPPPALVPVGASAAAAAGDQAANWQQGGDADMQLIRGLITAHDNFPNVGVRFQDVFPILRVPRAARMLLTRMTALVQSRYSDVDVVVGLDSRGFLFGVPMALDLDAAFVPVRKAGKLPGKCVQDKYQTEYSSAVHEVQADAIKRGQRVVLVDDLLATGGTLASAASLVRKLGATVVAAVVVIELKELKGRQLLISKQGMRSEDVHSLFQL